MIYYDKMMNGKLCFFMILFLMLTVLLFPAGSKEKNDHKKADIIQVRGTVRLIGSSNFPQLVISGSASQWYVTREDWDKLFNLQQQTVMVEGEETVTEMIYASGIPAGSRRELRNIRIIHIGE